MASSINSKAQQQLHGITVPSTSTQDTFPITLILHLMVLNNPHQPFHQASTSHMNKSKGQITELLTKRQPRILKKIRNPCKRKAIKN